MCSSVCRKSGLWYLKYFIIPEGIYWNIATYSQRPACNNNYQKLCLLLCSTFVHQKQHHIRGKPGASLLPNCIYFDLYIECNCICIIPNWQFYIGIVALGIFPHLRFIFVCSRLQLYLYHCTPFIFVYPVWVRTGLALADTFWKFIFSLNWA